MARGDRTLALAYAIKHPDRVAGLILRGVFLLTQRELNWFYQDGASMMFPDAWERFATPIPGRGTRRFGRRLPPSTDRSRPARQGSGGGGLEPVGKGDTLSLRGPQARPAKFNEVDFAVAFARIECHFFANKGFFDEDGWLLKNIAAIRGIPGWIVQGRFDVVTPLESAWALKTAWPEALASRSSGTPATPRPSLASSTP